MLRVARRCCTTSCSDPRRLPPTLAAWLAAPASPSTSSIECAALEVEQPSWLAALAAASRAQYAGDQIPSALQSKVLHSLAALHGPPSWAIPDESLLDPGLSKQRTLELRDAALGSVRCGASASLEVRRAQLLFDWRLGTEGGHRQLSNLKGAVTELELEKDPIAYAVVVLEGLSAAATSRSEESLRRAWAGLRSRLTAAQHDTLDEPVYRDLIAEAAHRLLWALGRRASWAWSLTSMLELKLPEAFYFAHNVWRARVHGREVERTVSELAGAITERGLCPRETSLLCSTPSRVAAAYVATGAALMHNWEAALAAVSTAGGVVPAVVAGLVARTCITADWRHALGLAHLLGGRSSAVDRELAMANYRRTGREGTVVPEAVALQAFVRCRGDGLPARVVSSACFAVAQQQGESAGWQQALGIVVRHLHQLPLSVVQRVVIRAPKNVELQVLERLQLRGLRPSQQGASAARAGAAYAVTIVQSPRSVTVAGHHSAATWREALIRLQDALVSGGQRCWRENAVEAMQLAVGVKKWDLAMRLYNNFAAGPVPQGVVPALASAALVSSTWWAASEVFDALSRCDAVPDERLVGNTVSTTFKLLRQCHRWNEAMRLVSLLHDTGAMPARTWAHWNAPAIIDVLESHPKWELALSLAFSKSRGAGLSTVLAGDVTPKLQLTLRSLVVLLGAKARPPWLAALAAMLPPAPIRPLATEVLADPATWMRLLQKTAYSGNATLAIELFSKLSALGLATDAAGVYCVQAIAKAPARCITQMGGVVRVRGVLLRILRHSVSHALLINLTRLAKQHGAAASIMLPVLLELHQHVVGDAHQSEEQLVRDFLLLAAVLAEDAPTVESLLRPAGVFVQDSYVLKQLSAASFMQPTFLLKSPWCAEAFQQVHHVATCKEKTPLHEYLNGPLHKLPPAHLVSRRIDDVLPHYTLKFCFTPTRQQRSDVDAIESIQHGIILANAGFDSQQAGRRPAVALLMKGHGVDVDALVRWWSLKVGQSVRPLYTIPTPQKGIITVITHAFPLNEIVCRLQGEAVLEPFQEPYAGLRSDGAIDVTQLSWLQYFGGVVVTRGTQAGKPKLLVTFRDLGHVEHGAPIKFHELVMRLALDGWKIVGCQRVQASFDKHNKERPTSHELFSISGVSVTWKPPPPHAQEPLIERTGVTLD